MADFGTIKTRVARITRTDECGVPVVGPKSSLTTSGYIQIALSPQYEDGTETRVRNGWGELLVNQRDDPSFLGVNATADFVKVHPDTLDMVTSSRTVLDGADAVGVAYKEGPVTARFAIETWTQVLGSGACEGGVQWLYWLLPFNGNGRLGDFTLGAEQATFSLTFSSIAAPADVWTAGATPATTGSPYELSYLPADAEVLEGEHFYFGLTTGTPPAAVSGAVALA